MKTSTQEKPAKREIEKKTRTTKNRAEIVESTTVAPTRLDEKAKTTKAAETVESTTEAQTKVTEKAKTAKVVVTMDTIAKRAYQLWQARGCVHGHDQQDWLQAEAELRG